MSDNGDTLSRSEAQGIVESCYADVLAYCRRHAPRGCEEDLAQETFLRFARQSSYEDRGNPKAYLLTIARNLCVDASRARSRTQAVLHYGDLRDFDPPDPRDAFADAEIAMALDTLDPESREIVELRFDQGLSASEIGQILGMSRFSVHRKLKRILDRLKREVAPDAPADVHSGECSGKEERK